MSYVLVTGGCGFIGSHLCEALLAAGHRVRVLDDLSSGSVANLAPGASLMVGSVASPADVAAAMADVDACIHLAAIASVQKCTEDWIGTHKVNLSGTINVFDAARGQGVPVVYASSAAVYGTPDRSPLTEDAPVRPLSAYGADKLGCELHARVAGEVHGLRTFGLRFFNVFGPRQDPLSPYSGVISIFCERIARGQRVLVHGDGGQTRDFVHVTDVVAALVAAIPAAARDAPVVNVCTGHATSILDLAAAIGRVSGCAPHLDHGPARVGDIRESIGSPDMLWARLRVRAAMRLDTGLASVVQWLGQGCPGLSDQPTVSRITMATPLHIPSESAMMVASEVRDSRRG